jgi:TatA/E family protein of Tat protein translocase
MMPTVLLVFEFLGTSELMIIAVVALIIFGPRKLPEIGRSLGRTLGEFKRASEDFKRTWEYEVELEQRSAPQTQPAGGGVEGMSGHVAAGEIGAGAAGEGETVARGSGPDAAQAETPGDAGAVVAAEGADAVTYHDDAVTYHDDAAQPGAHELTGEDLTDQSQSHTGPGEPRDS